MATPRCSTYSIVSSWWLKLSKSKMVVAAFPQSAIKIVVQSNEGEITREDYIWMPVFQTEFHDIMEAEKDQIDEIYVLGPTAYTSKVIEMIEDETDIPVIKEG